ncbi:2-deoxy-D-gluconate 3-dehydrogenase [Hydrogenispora ethanolica]|jgi:2-deoxy-D-gluconate 3-dehydrogenase|uniref:2-deoxy-D-gluconate 3-dehydrogenase n=1 Tax=Hydrogenispora ethanolica TaxID=1082276 RepID=A0A4R1S292_HYDET|nr:SDR family oxidoreductase [Hydrogenispora ethanolica]TCL72442.1 2-deoxy-D-gluconate 3-dehydrogenase [Hydrogenispora ethanolica]
MSDLLDVSGKKAIVTGGAAGLGLAMTEVLLEHGAEVAIIGRSERVEAAAHDLGKLGQVYPVRGDLGDRLERRRVFEAALKALGTVDILVNNAGIQIRHRCEEFPLEDWDRVLETDLTAVFELCQMAGRIMLATGRGKIINIASLISFSGGLNIPAYAAAKGGVAQITKAFANEWAGRGVNVNAIAPGYMDTEMNTALKNNPTRFDSIMERIPAGRWGTPADLKGITLLLASAASDYIHGVVIPVDGGFMSR